MKNFIFFILTVVNLILTKIVYAENNQDNFTITMTAVSPSVVFNSGIPMGITEEELYALNPKAQNFITIRNLESEEFIEMSTGLDLEYENTKENEDRNFTLLCPGMAKDANSLIEEFPDANPQSPQIRSRRFIFDVASGVSRLVEEVRFEIQQVNKVLDGESCSGIYYLLINGWKMEVEFSNSTYSAQIKSLSKP